MTNDSSHYTWKSQAAVTIHGNRQEEEEEEEEEDLFVFNDTIEGPRAPAVKPGGGGGDWRLPGIVGSHPLQNHKRVKLSTTVI